MNNQRRHLHFCNSFGHCPIIFPFPLKIALNIHWNGQRESHGQFWERNWLATPIKQSWSISLQFFLHNSCRKLKSPLLLEKPPKEGPTLNSTNSNEFPSADLWLIGIPTGPPNWELCSWKFGTHFSPLPPQCLPEAAPNKRGQISDSRHQKPHWQKSCWRHQLAPSCFVCVPHAPLRVCLLHLSRHTCRKCFHAISSSREMSWPKHI